ncbi:MAG: hypothetical protein LBH58_14625 [Tannerellaceae bacterium]|jgi:hypothetical protein|nr:hypothetical protein [Tannerellaceae bacterium]
MKSKRWVLWILLLLAAFVFMSGGCGSGSSSVESGDNGSNVGGDPGNGGDNPGGDPGNGGDNPGGGFNPGDEALSYKDYEGDWRGGIWSSNGSRLQLSIRNVQGSDERFTADISATFTPGWEGNAETFSENGVVFERFHSDNIRHGFSFEAGFIEKFTATPTVRFVGFPSYRDGIQLNSYFKIDKPSGIGNIGDGNLSRVR